MSRRRSVLAPEGLPYVAALAAAAWVAALLGSVVLSVALGAVGGVVAYFFRDPDRHPPSDDPSAVLSPADGTVTDVGLAREPHFLGREMVKVGVFLSLLDCHVVRFPLGCRIVDASYTRGGFQNARLKRASVENERMALLVELEDGAQAVVVLVAGLLARRIVLFHDVGEGGSRGERLGIIKFGSRVDLYLPPERFEAAVTVGAKVRAGETIIGRYDEKGS